MKPTDKDVKLAAGIADYDAASDDYYWPEGWYEDTDHSAFHLGGIEPTHWWPLDVFHLPQQEDVSTSGSTPSAPYGTAKFRPGRIAVPACLLGLLL